MVRGQPSDHSHFHMAPTHAATRRLHLCSPFPRAMAKKKKAAAPEEVPAKKGKKKAAAKK